MKKLKVAFYPYAYSNNDYISIMQYIISKKCEIYDYLDLKKMLVNEVDILYLNWIEDNMDDQDKSLILQYKEKGKKIVWVFHNRISHSRELRKKTYYNLKFLAINVTDIIIHSKHSINYLYEYIDNPYEKNIHYVAHPNYRGCYGSLVDRDIDSRVQSDKFIFGSIGSLREDKNIDILINAYKKFPYKNDSLLMIVGDSASEVYIEKIREKIENEKNIILIPRRAMDYSLDYYVKKTNVVMMPYDIESCINSGIMLLAFSNGRTVITSNISMAEDFEPELIYKYQYDRSNHEDILVSVMTKTYLDGRKTVLEKGKKLQNFVLENNSYEVVDNQLSNIIGGGSNNKPFVSEISAVKKQLFSLENLWEENFNRYFIKIIKDNNYNIGLYGFGRYGKIVKRVLEENNIPISCIIDKNRPNVQNVLCISDIEELSIKLDCLLITTIYVDIQEIRKYMTIHDENCYVLSLSDIY